MGLVACVLRNVTVVRGTAERDAVHFVGQASLGATKARILHCDTTRGTPGTWLRVSRCALKSPLTDDDEPLVYCLTRGRRFLRFYVVHMIS